MRYLLDKGARLVPALVEHPRLIGMIPRGVHAGEFINLDVPWIKQAGIRTVLDIGANTGQFAGAAHAVLPNARIYSFEPLTDCYEELIHRFSGERNFQAFNVALGCDEGRTTFYRNSFTKSSSILPMLDLHRGAFPWTAPASATTVELRRLDSFWDELRLQPEVLVKIDTQGYEDRVILGGERIICTAKYVFVETSFEPLYEAQASFETIYDAMTNRGFRYAGNIDQLESPGDGRILQADALFVRRG